eukprot:1480461-Pleurochrysis_carterae.AAC.1
MAAERVRHCKHEENRALQHLQQSVLSFLLKVPAPAQALPGYEKGCQACGAPLPTRPPRVRAPPETSSSCGHGCTCRVRSRSGSSRRTRGTPPSAKSSCSGGS